MKKYRIAAFALAAAMLVPSLAACGLKKGEIEISEASAEESISAKKADVTTAKAEESTTEVTTTAAVTTTAPATTAAPTTAAPTTEAPTTAAPTTEAPTEAPSKKTPTAAEVAADIAARQSLFAEELMESSASRGLSLFGLDSGEVAEAAYYKATAAVADELLVVKLAPGASADTVRAGFAQRQSAQAEDYEDYVPAEVPKINDAVFYQNGDIMVFCVSNDSAAVRSALDSLF